MKTFIMRRDVTKVTATVHDPDNGTYRLPNVSWHSDHFEWGYYGGGPAALAESILAAVLGSKDHPDMEYAGWIKEDLVAHVPHEGGMISEVSVREWLAHYKQTTQPVTITRVEVG